MKLFKKLLPIATIGSVAAVITPLATSCSKWVTIDGNSIYVPTVAQAVCDAEHASTGYTDPQAQAMYYDHIIENPDVLFQDYIASLAYNAFTVIHNPKSEGSECKIKEKFSNLSANKEEARISYDFEGKIYLKSFRASDDYTLDANFSTKMKVNNVQGLMTYVDNKGWTFAPGLGNINGNGSIEATVNGQILATGGPAYWYTFHNETYVLTSETIPDIKWQVIRDLFGYFILSTQQSFHMANIEHSDD